MNSRIREMNQPHHTPLSHPLNYYQNQNSISKNIQCTKIQHHLLTSYDFPPISSPQWSSTKRTTQTSNRVKQQQHALTTNSCTLMSANYSWTISHLSSTTKSRLNSHVWLNTSWINVKAHSSAIRKVSFTFYPEVSSANADWHGHQQVSKYILYQNTTQEKEEKQTAQKYLNI